MTMIADVLIIITNESAILGCLPAHAPPQRDFTCQTINLANGTFQRLLLQHLKKVKVKCNQLV